VVEGGKRE
jgi:hypothetical protein